MELQNGKKKKNGGAYFLSSLRPRHRAQQPFVPKNSSLKSQNESRATTARVAQANTWIGDDGTKAFQTDNWWLEIKMRACGFVCLNGLSGTTVNMWNNSDCVNKSLHASLACQYLLGHLTRTILTWYCCNATRMEL